MGSNNLLYGQAPARSTRAVDPQSPYFQLTEEQQSCLLALSLLERESPNQEGFAALAIKDKVFIIRSSLIIKSGVACLRNLKNKNLVKSKRAGVGTKIYTTWQLSPQGRDALLRAGLL